VLVKVAVPIVKCQDHTPTPGIVYPFVQGGSFRVLDQVHQLTLESIEWQIDFPASRSYTVIEQDDEVARTTATPDPERKDRCLRGPTHDGRGCRYRHLIFLGP